MLKFLDGHTTSFQFAYFWVFVAKKEEKGRQQPCMHKQFYCKHGWKDLEVTSGW